MQTAKRIALAVCLAVAIVVIVMLRSCGSHHRAAPPARSRLSNVPAATLAHATPSSIAGTTVPGALVCLDTELDCMPADARGHYAFRDLPPARYVVTAAAAGHRPATATIVLAAAQDATVDLVLANGGVAITGVVSDRTGGPIAHARVTASRSVAESGVDGAYTLWLPSGTTQVTAAASGYATGIAGGYAPGRVDFALLPEGTISGTVIDAETAAPVVGARVVTDGGEATTDDVGAFQIGRLAWGRHALTARTDHGYGESTGAIVVDVARGVEGVVIEMVPAALVEGQVVLAGTQVGCTDALVNLDDYVRQRHAVLRERADGRFAAAGVLPGTYEVRVFCDGYVTRTKYPPVIVDRDVSGLVWEVDVGATLEGRVTTKSGTPIARVSVSGFTYVPATTGRPRSLSRWSESDAEGRYRITGILPGRFRVEVGTGFSVVADEAVEIELAAGASGHRDFVRDDTGGIRGRVVDAGDHAMRDVQVEARGARDSRYATTDDSGAFLIPEATAGEWDVAVYATERYGPTRSSHVVVREGEVATVDVVGRSAQTGTIRGDVFRRLGTPVADARVVLVRERGEHVELGAFSGNRTSAITDADGHFSVSGLPIGLYSIHAEVAGIGDALVEHVPTNASTFLRLRPGATLRGTIHTNAPVDELAVRIDNTEYRFFRTTTFELHDLPAGRHEIAAGAVGRAARTSIDLVAGDTTTVTLELRDEATVRGRVVDESGAPIANAHVRAPWTTSFVHRDFDDTMTNAEGRFVIGDVPAGEVTFTVTVGGRVTPVVRDISAREVDLGDVRISE